MSTRFFVFIEAFLKIKLSQHPDRLKQFIYFKSQMTSDNETIAVSHHRKIAINRYYFYLQKHVRSNIFIICRGMWGVTRFWGKFWCGMWGKCMETTYECKAFHLYINVDVRHIKVCRLRWIGHMMLADWIPKRLLEDQLCTRRRIFRLR